MRAAFYWWRAVRGRSWRPVLTVMLVGGLLGAVALGAVAGARRTLSAYGRYLTSAKVSDAFVNVPGAIPGMPLTRPITLISKLPGVAASAGYLGLADDPVVHGRIVDSHLTNGLIGSYTGAYFRQDRMTVLAGRLPAVNSTDQIALSPGIASLFGVGVGGTVTYAFSNTFGPPGARPVLHSFKVTAIVDVPPVLVDRSDQSNVGVLPPGATRRLLSSYEFAWVGVRLARRDSRDTGPSAAPGGARDQRAAAGVPDHPSAAAGPDVPDQPHGRHRGQGAGGDQAAGGRALRARRDRGAGPARLRRSGPGSAARQSRA